MDIARDSACSTAMPVRLYHGSDAPIEHPDVTYNTGFADLGKGFYLSDDHGAARGRARLRAMRRGGDAGVISTFELDEARIPWVVWGAEGLAGPENAQGGSFGLRFEESPAGIAAWARYIGACRRGKTELAALGDPAIVRGWIATEEIEMFFAGFATAEDLAAFLDPAELTVQYCLREQRLIDTVLSFEGTETVTV